jgi:hypothetical protein
MQNYTLRLHDKVHASFLASHTSGPHITIAIFLVCIWQKVNFSNLG